MKEKTKIKLVKLTILIALMLFWYGVIKIII